MRDPRSDRIFISYSHSDKGWLRRLQVHLQPLVSHYGVSVWDDTQIAPGTDWRAEISRALSSAKVAVLLVSPHFLASAFIATHELPLLLQAASLRGLRIFWIAIHSSLYQETPIARYQAANDPARPLSSLQESDQNKELVEICAKLKAALLVESTEAGQVAKKPPCPYRGLFAFGEEDAELFFGRAALTDHLLRAIRQKDLVAVLGSSGSGKSSLVFAGLVPRIRREDGWIVTSLRPFDNPFYNLSAALIPVLEPQVGQIKQLEDVDELANALKAGRISVENVIKQILRSRPSVHNMLLIVDQFEEIYSLCKSRDEQTAFIDALLALRSPTRDTKRVKVVVTLRADFLGQALSYSPFVDALQDADVKLGPLSTEELRDAIEKPAYIRNVKVEPGLTQRIVQAVNAAPGNLPLLEFALSLLWELQESDTLTHTAYDKIGGVERALANHAETVYSRLEESEKLLASEAFIQLVHPGDGTWDSRRRSTRSELGDERWNLLSRLADEDSRLVVSGRSELTGEDTVELVHEALISGWTRLQGWLAENRDFRIWQERLRFLMRLWEENKRKEDAVLPGVFLDEAESWMDLRSREIAQVEREFIKASQESRDERGFREQDREQDRLAALGMLAAGVAHEINTPITGISSYAQMLLADTSESDPRYEILRKLERQCFRAARIINNLLEFARNRGRERKVLSLVPLLEEAVDLLGDRLDKRQIKIAWSRPAEEVMVFGEEGELQQVFVNILINAIDAMEMTGGRVDLGVQVLVDKAEIWIRDTGPGIPTERIEKIFQPFFSTKLSQGGAGFGLAISYEIIRRHGGVLRVESHAGEGACFIAELPLHVNAST